MPYDKEVYYKDVADGTPRMPRNHEPIRALPVKQSFSTNNS